MKITALPIPTQGNSYSPSREMMQPLALSQPPSLQDKLAAFDPLLHGGGEAMLDQPLGEEFGAVLIDRNRSNL
jgi:hypothetical protein